VLFRTRFGRLRFTWSPSRWMKELKESFPVGLTSLLTQTVTNLPILIVGILLTTREAGAFNAAMKLVFFVLIIDRVFYAVFLPVISRQTKEAGSLFLGMVFLAVRVVLALTIPIAVIGMLLAPEIVNFVFGAGYAEAIPVLESLLPYVVFTLVNTVIMSALVAVNKQSEYLAVMGWGTGALVVLCVILTIVAGVNGTAMSLPLGEAVMTGMVIWKAGNALGPGLTRECAPAFGSGLVMAAAAFALRSVSPFLAVPAVLACFLGSLALLKGIRREDVSFLREKFV